jgi:hypothetical protein
VADPSKPRLLASRSERGYTSSDYEAMRTEPEAVSEQEQRDMTAAVHRAEQERLRREWSRTEGAIGHELDHFVHSGANIDGQVFSGVRAVRRAARAVGRKVERELREEGAA